MTPQRPSVKSAIREAGRRGLRRAGLQVGRTGGGGPRRTLAQALAHVRDQGFIPATVIDVGVASGTPELYAAFPDAALLLVEPMREWEPQLRELLATRRGELITAAAGAAPGERTLRVHRVPACSSMVGERVGDGALLEDRTVPLITLDAAARTRALPPPFLLKVDVEGGELDVLEGAGDLLAQTEVVILEVSLFELNTGAPQFADVVAAMHDRGWVPYDVFGGHLRPLDGALAQLDVAFVRADGRFRSDHRYATPEQADRLYRSWGL